MTASEAKYPELAGRAAVVTGAGRGLGEAHARALVRNRVNVVAGDIDLRLVTETARRINAEEGSAASVVPARIDVASREDHDVLAELACRRFGRLDHWINNAGIFPEAGVRSITPEQFGTTFGINVNGVLFGAQAAVAAMDGSGGSLVNMASIAAFTVRRERASYGASKAAVEHLTRFLAVELGPAGIRVNAIAPGIIDTQMAAWIHESPEVFEATMETIPLRRPGTAADVADAMLFLISDAASFITGHTLVVDGGGRYC
ncbi:SDR family NAD(P)-dependent oxidoreductase [Arthrobacter mobilis]|uniref:SDR family oxidoreductase n=1 Tax=Arthrobacter mobilis TaxID=2724944 RepID=A0A7X6HGU6_9MICC|nr:SDR family oxidoreductase [Arthrobacter mobilis]NKX55908.1 SDR family oxidoreductase [Arthrobacter mobilis]